MRKFVLFVVALKAILSSMCEAPDMYGCSYLLPLSKYNPTAMVAPGVFSEAIVAPFESVVTKVFGASFG
jgi:hypothetical protein